MLGQVVDAPMTSYNVSDEWCGASPCKLVLGIFVLVAFGKSVVVSADRCFKLQEPLCSPLGTNLTCLVFLRSFNPAAGHHPPIHRLAAALVPESAVPLMRVSCGVAALMPH